MSVLEKALRDAGVQLTGNNSLPKDQRGVKVFQRVIQSVRAAEAALLDMLSDAERNLNSALQDNLKLHECVRQLEAENLKHRLWQKVDQISGITAGDRNRLLEVVRPEHKESA